MGVGGEALRCSMLDFQPWERMRGSGEVGKIVLGDGKFEAGGTSPKEMGWGFSCPQGVKTMGLHCRGRRFKSWRGMKIPQAMWPSQK